MLNISLVLANLLSGYSTNILIKNFLIYIEKYKLNLTFPNSEVSFTPEYFNQNKL